jgi:hypothetical protein
MLEKRALSKYKIKKRKKKIKYRRRDEKIILLKNKTKRTKSTHGTVGYHYHTESGLYSFYP